MAEIMQDKATSVATVMNWTISLIVSATIPTIVDLICGKEIDNVRANAENIGYIFIACSIFTVFGLLLIIFSMKETRGLSPEEIERMFVIDKDFTNKKV
jgi:hypothetical protein